MSNGHHPPKATKPAARQAPARERRDGPTGSSLFVGSVAKAFRVLAVFDQGQRSLPLVQIASLSGLDLSATQRFVHTLVVLQRVRIRVPHPDPEAAL